MTNIGKNSFDLPDLLKGSQGLSKLPDDTWRSAVVREKWYYFVPVDREAAP